MYIADPKIDFDTELGNLRFRGLQFSEQTKESINNYLFKGWMPGGHLESQFAHDLERALYNADTHNRTVFWAIAMWIREHAPEQAQGSYRAVEEWCKNPELREEFRAECEKKTMWKTLEKA
jgi:hypothetical protein